MNLPHNIDEVISHLDLILDESIENSNPLGLFAALYQKVTIKVKEGIANDRFEDGKRMEKLDVLFANRYLEAYQVYKTGTQEMNIKSWRLTFDAAKNQKILLMQHLFMAMNVHINLDLGIAAAMTVGNGDINALKNDFLEINNLLFDLVGEVQDNIATVSPFLGLLDIVAKNRDERFAEFSMNAARKHAWLVAQRISSAKSDQQGAVIKSVDEYVAELGDLILKPGLLIRIANWIIGLAESKDVVKNIRALRFKK